MTVDRARARSFDAWAGQYDRFRPGYPNALFDVIASRLALPPRPLVVDLGAGTGRASLAMAARGWRVTAVEPGRPMLDILRARAADLGLVISTVQATAEATGLDPGSVDLVTAGQSFHWFEKEAALAEIARITRIGGGVALFWNVRDRDRSPFLETYARLLERHVEHGGDMGRYETEGRNETQRAFEAHRAAFEPPQLLELHHEVEMTAEEFMGLAFTASYVRVLPDVEQERIRLELADLLGHHRLNQGRPFAVPYRTDLWIARRSDS
jgi:SAM-dependent methyltransferase